MNTYLCSFCISLLVYGPLPSDYLTVDKDFVYKDIAIHLDDAYDSISEALKDEDLIDWDVETEKANTITTAFAAHELQEHFRLLGKKVEVKAYAKESTDNAIVIIPKSILVSNHPEVASRMDFKSMGNQGFSILPYGKNIYIGANTRVGLLYGAYELLKKMGFKWYRPSETIVPKKPEKKSKFYHTAQIPFVSLRGFWTFSEKNLEASYAIWMARNKLNIVGSNIKPQLAKKLGIKIWGGGHKLIQEEFSKKGLFDLHPDWFVFYKNKHIPVAANGNYVNPAYSNNEAAEYFSRQVIERLSTGDLKQIDVLNIWPADKRNDKLDQSETSKALGNFTDTLLFFYSVLSENLEQAYLNGTLPRRVTLAGISYHMTMEPPTNRQVVDNLEKQNYLHIFYPSTKDWSSPLTTDLKGNDTNRYLVERINKWRSLTDFEYGFVDYYNKSNYGGLALSAHNNFAEDFDFYFPKPDGLYAYMHPIESNPGPLQLTNALIAGLTWKSMDDDTASMANKIIESYFSAKYGRYAKEWKQLYDDMFKSISNAKFLFESESLSAVLFQEFFWKAPPFTKKEVLEHIPKYLEGGSQNLPNIYVKQGKTHKANFIGLNESIGIQAKSKSRWKAITERVKDEQIKERMNNDILWFESASSRYRLFSYCAQYTVAKLKNEPFRNLEKQIQDEMDYLSATEVTNDLISTVDQRGFLKVIERMVNSDD